MEQTRDQILEEARKILKTNELRINKKGWAEFWCPAHPDEQRGGTTGVPNFAIDLNTGRYNCFRCGFKGGSLYSLAKKLGATYRPKQAEFIVKRPKREINGGVTVANISEALADAQSRILSSSAMSYLKHRGVTPYTAMMYVLEYGIGSPVVSHATTDTGYKLGLVYRREWLWSESVVYAEPVTDPAVLNVRYLPPEYMRRGRGFELSKHPHRTWGDRLAPLGAWRITERTQAVMVVEGLFDMLVGAQFLDQRRAVLRERIQQPLPLFDHAAEPGKFGSLVLLFRVQPAHLLIGGRNEGGRLSEIEERKCLQMIFVLLHGQFQRGSDELGMAQDPVEDLVPEVRRMLVLRLPLLELRKFFQQVIVLHQVLTV